MSLVRSRQALEHFAGQTANLPAHAFGPTWCDHQGFRDSDFCSCYFLTRSKTDISGKVRFPYRCSRPILFAYGRAGRSEEYAGKATAALSLHDDASGERKAVSRYAWSEPDWHNRTPKTSVISQRVPRRYGPCASESRQSSQSVL